MGRAARAQRRCGWQVFAHLHKLSLNYYAENEAGNVMSRITNDMETINQAISFALVSVPSGALLLVWVAYNMLTKNLAYALISMAGGAGDGRGDQRRSRAGRAAALPGHPPGDRQGQRRPAGEHLRGARGAGLWARRSQHRILPPVNAANRDANIAAVAITATLIPDARGAGLPGDRHHHRGGRGIDAARRQTCLAPPFRWA